MYPSLTSCRESVPQETMRQQEASGIWRGPWRTCEAVELATLQWERPLRAPARACPAWLPAPADACRVFSAHHPYRDASPALFPAILLPDDAASGRRFPLGRIESGGNPAAEPPSCPTAPGNLPTTRPPPRVGLLVTCLVDLFRPAVGFAAVRLLEDAGCVVDMPAVQTCCGQPAYNGGDSGID